MEHIQDLLNDARQHVHNSLDVSDETIRRLHDRVMRALPKAQKTPKKWIPATVAAITVAAAAVMVMPRVIDYSNTIASDPIPAKINRIGQLSDNEKMLLLETVPFGATYEQIKQMAPELSQQMPEGGMESPGPEGLTQAVMLVKLYNVETKIEFNFRNGKMYSFYYIPGIRDPHEAANLEKKVVEFYTKTYGPSESEKQANGAGATTEATTQWTPQPNFTVSVTNSRNYDNTAYLAWGFQLSESEQEKWAAKEPASNTTDALLVGVKIGDTPEQVRAALGTDYKEAATDGLHSGTTWTYPGIAVFFVKDTNKVMSVTINKPGYKTSLGATLGDKADTVLSEYRAKYKEFISPHTNSPITGWFEVEPGVLLIFDFDASDGMQANNKITSGSKVKSIGLVSRQALD